MPRFIDRNAAERREIGPCECPNKPHETDYVRIRQRLSYPDQLHLADAMAQGATEGMWALFNLRVVGWNLVDEKGKPVPLSRANWQNLDDATAQAIQREIEQIREASEGTEDLPNT